MPRIALIGDSHAKVVFRYLKKMLPELGFDNVYTKAENGWSVKQHIKKGTLPQLKKAKPEIILVSLGGNNQQMNSSKYISTINQLIKTAESIGANIVWVGPTTSNTQKAANTERRHKKTHQILSSYLPRKNIYYIDNRSFTAGGWAKDGVHYPSSFYKKWAQRVAKYLKKVPAGKGSWKKYALWSGIGVGVLTVIGVTVKLVFGEKKGSKANSTKCLTPDARFHTEIGDRKISMEVDLPMDLNLNEKEAEILETVWHNATESVLRPYFYDKSSITGE